MNGDLLRDLRRSVQNTDSFQSLDEYFEVCDSFLNLLESKPIKITSPSHHNYIFYQYDETFNHTITRPINSDLFIGDKVEFEANIPILMEFLQDLKKEEDSIVDNAKWKDFISSNTINNMVYTIQQSIGCIADAFEIPNQARKRQGQLFENFIIQLIKKVGLNCLHKISFPSRVFFCKLPVDPCKPAARSSEPDADCLEILCGHDVPNMQDLPVYLPLTRER